jgi:hypothetical protein
MILKLKVNIDAVMCRVYEECIAASRSLESLSACSPWPAHARRRSHAAALRLFSGRRPRPPWAQGSARYTVSLGPKPMMSTTAGLHEVGHPGGLRVEASRRHSLERRVVRLCAITKIPSPRDNSRGSSVGMGVSRDSCVGRDAESDGVEPRSPRVTRENGALDSRSARRPASGLGLRQPGDCGRRQPSGGLTPGLERHGPRRRLGPAVPPSTSGQHPG